MLTNNIELDLKTRMIEDGVTQTEIAKHLGVSIPYVNRIIRGKENIINKTFIGILDGLVYDVELTYKKKRGMNRRRIRKRLSTHLRRLEL